MFGCDKPTPGLVTGALSMGLPFVCLPAGPMRRRCCRSREPGSGSHAWNDRDERRAGQIDDAEWQVVEAGACP